MALNSEDMQWLDERFERLTRSHNEIVGKAASDKAELVDRIQKAREQHEAKHHDIAKNIGILATIAAFLVGLAEGLKYFFMERKG